jgi:TRAP-type uncharacterized transport system substrate-binding protein
MSICHIKLKKISESELNVSYEIYSFDFNPKHEWEKFGVIDIDKINTTFVHKNNDLWEKNKIFPINAMEVPLNQRKELKETRYKGYSSARWASHVYNFIKKCLETREFPEERNIVS